MSRATRQGRVPRPRGMRSHTVTVGPSPASSVPCPLSAFRWRDASPHVRSIARDGRIGARGLAMVGLGLTQRRRAVGVAISRRGSVRSLMRRLLRFDEHPASLPPSTRRAAPVALHAGTARPSVGPARQGLVRARDRRRAGAAGPRPGAAEGRPAEGSVGAPDPHRAVKWIRAPAPRTEEGTAGPGRPMADRAEPRALCSAVRNRHAIARDGTAPQVLVMRP